MFEQLTLNIRKRGILESLPYCARTERGIEIVSGHHRIRALRAAGIKEVYILLDDSGLSREEIIAKQLAHNAIQGYDDKQLLKRLFDQIKDAELRLEAFIREETLNDLKLPPVKPVGQIELKIDAKKIMLSFLPIQMSMVTEAIEYIKNNVKGDEEEKWIAERKNYDEFIEAISRAMDSYRIRNVSFALAKLVELAMERMNDEN